MVAMTIVGLLSTFKITPSLPPWLGYILLLAIIVSAVFYFLFSVARLWFRVIGGPIPGSYRINHVKP